jgi:hypothetical protein
MLSIFHFKKSLSPPVDNAGNIRIIRASFLSRRSSVAEQLICNQLVVSSTLTAGSIFIKPLFRSIPTGVFWPLSIWMESI